MQSELLPRYMKMEDDALLAIVHSASYRPDARELAEALLRERGLSSEAINQWRDPNATLADPPWDNGPWRILLLRPFEFRNRGHLPRLFAKRYLTGLGHVYTLVDGEIKPWRSIPPIVKVALWLFGLPGILLFFPPRLSFNVSCHEDIPRLMEWISRRVARNLVRSIAFDKLFKITCAQDTWRRVMQYLINSADLIVIDLSQGGEGLKWEIEEILFYGASDKVVFVTHQETASSARLFMNSIGVTEGVRELFVYGDDGRATKHDELSVALLSVAFRSVSTYKN